MFHLAHINSAHLSMWLRQSRYSNDDRGHWKRSWQRHVYIILVVSRHVSPKGMFCSRSGGKHIEPPKTANFVKGLVSSTEVYHRNIYCLDG